MSCYARRWVWLVRFGLGAYLWLGLAFLGENRAAPAPDSAAFDSANKLYEQGKYTNAIAAYRQLLDAQQVSPAVYFNLGNAYFKAGLLGQALVCYRLAERITPRDPDIRANLRFARGMVGGPSASGSRWERWTQLLSLNELTLVSAGLLWLWFMLLAAGQWRRDWARDLRPYQWMAGLAVVLAAAWLGLIAQQRLGRLSAVVTAREAVVRYGPFDEAQSAFTLRDGNELTVLNEKETWLQVTDGSNRIGWVPAHDVTLLPRG